MYLQSYYKDSFFYEGAHFVFREARWPSGRASDS